MQGTSNIYYLEILFIFIILKFYIYFLYFILRYFWNILFKVLLLDAYKWDVILIVGKQVLMTNWFRCVPFIYLKFVFKFLFLFLKRDIYLWEGADNVYYDVALVRAMNSPKKNI